MEPTNQSESKNWREYRRKRVWEMHQQGYKQQAIADALGVTQSGVSQMIKRAKEGGESALDHHTSPGAPKRMTDEQRQQLLVELAQGAEAHGYAGNVWTTERIAHFIEKRFKVKYHPDYIGPLLRQLGWSPQRPIVRASQRDEAAIQEWVSKQWPELKKKAVAEGRTILFIDESAFYLLPGVVRTWAPKGQTPILHGKLTYDHYSVISAITLTGALYLAMQTEAFNSKTVIAFLEQLLATLTGKLLIIWDGATIHRSQAIKDFLAAGAAERLWLERLPAYAPDLNPDEGIWHYLKHVELKNVCCQDLTQLSQQILDASERLRAKPHIITACFACLDDY